MSLARRVPLARCAVRPTKSPQGRGIRPPYLGEYGDEGAATYVRKLQVVGRVGQKHRRQRKCPASRSCPGAVVVLAGCVLAGCAIHLPERVEHGITLPRSRGT